MNVALLALAFGLPALVAILCVRNRTLLTSELHRSRTAFSDCSTQLDAVLGPGNAYHFKWDVKGGSVFRVSVGVDTAAGVPGSDFSQLLSAVHPADAERVRGKLTAVEQGASDTLNDELRLRTSMDSDWRRYVVSARVSKTRNGRPTEVRGLALDVTSLRQVEAEATNSEHRFRQLAEAMPQIVYVSRHDGAIEYANARWTTYTGIASAAPDDLHLVVHPDDLPALAAEWQVALRDQTELSAEFRLRNAADGQYRWFLTRATPARDSSGAVVRWYGTSTDIEDVRATHQALEQSDRRKDEFLATLAHELRNPLAPIRNAITILQLSRSQAELPWAIGLIDRQLKQMTRLIDDLMDVSRINEGKLTLRATTLDVRTVVHDAVEMCGDIISLGKHVVSVEQPAQPVDVHGDNVRLAQVIANLVNNAVKYSDPGAAIIVRIADDETCASISVHDAGIGIPEDQLDAVFGMFNQVPDAVYRSKGGLGIGLALVKRLVDLHGGTVRAESAGAGQGSTFTIRLPLASATAPRTLPPPLPPVPSPPTALRVLLVDDNADAVDSLAVLIEMRGATVRTVLDGLSVLAAAQEFRPEVVVLDIGLPGANGYEVCRMIRSQSWGAALPLIALTGWGQEHDRNLAMAAGFDRHLPKPAHPDDLMRVIGELVRRT